MRARPQKKASEGVAAAVLACSPPRSKWRRVGGEPRSGETRWGPRAADYRRCAGTKELECPGGTGILARSPGGTSGITPAAISAMQGDRREKRDRDSEIPGARERSGSSARKSEQQAFNKQ